MRIQPKLLPPAPGSRRHVIEFGPGWTMSELIDRYGRDSHGNPRGLAFRPRSAAHAVAA